MGQQLIDRSNTQANFIVCALEWSITWEVALNHMFLPFFCMALKLLS